VGDERQGIWEGRVGRAVCAVRWPFGVVVDGPLGADDGGLGVAVMLTDTAGAFEASSARGGASTGKGTSSCDVTPASCRADSDAGGFADGDGGADFAVGAAATARDRGRAGGALAVVAAAGGRGFPAATSGPRGPGGRGRASLLIFEDAGGADFVTLRDAAGESVEARAAAVTARPASAIS